MLSKKNEFRAIVSVMVVISYLGWSCSTKKVGPTEPSKIKTAEILEDLANVETQTEAEIAIGNLFDKIGVGRQVVGRKHEHSVLLEEKISQLAEVQLEFTDSETSLVEANFGRIFETLVHLDKNWFASFDLNAVLTELQEQASIAFSDPEEANNAIAISIISRTTIPETVPVLNATTALSPIQTFLFLIWVDKAFGHNETGHKTTDIQSCTEAEVYECLIIRALCMAICAPADVLWYIKCNDEAIECLLDCEIHDQGGG